MLNSFFFDVLLRKDLYFYKCGTARSVVPGIKAVYDEVKRVAKVINTPYGLVPGEFLRKFSLK